jgi:hypothetical protein
MRSEWPTTSPNGDSELSLRPPCCFGIHDRKTHPSNVVSGAAIGPLQYLHGREASAATHPIQHALSFGRRCGVGHPPGTRTALPVVEAASRHGCQSQKGHDDD